MAFQSEITLTRAQVRELDRRAIEDFGIPGIVLMENAGRNAAGIILRHAAAGAAVAIICGRGNNGGDGFVIARHLDNAGVRVDVFLACDPQKLTGDAVVNHRIIERMGIAWWPFDTAEQIAAHQTRLCSESVIIDAVLGTGFSGQVRPPLDLVIQAVNLARENGPERATPRNAPPRIIAIDVPSGLDCDTGLPSNATVRADETITFVACKSGFRAPGASEFLGSVHVADIGAPRRLVEDVSARR
jgi:NAD(P)H-hydrate epimerase